MQLELAQIIDSAAREARAVSQLSHHQAFTEAEAYQIQAASIDRRIRRGERLIGYKLGFTSRAKMAQMGVHDMIWGRLTDAMLYEEGGSLPLDRFIHPRAEPEIAFRIAKRIEAPIHLLEASQYVAAVAPALEIIDSRYERFKFSLEDVIADNCSSAGVVLGNWRAADADLDNLGMVLEVDQRPVQVGSSAAILGHPLRCLVAAARLVTQSGGMIEAGAILLAGAATAAVYLERGQYVQARVQDLGRVGIKVI
ncbi:MAG: fumarylacetoacetate hydrolase family protein [Bacteroidota bacterium]